ncbi:MAG: sigma-54-dependent Fis family transcriptional regulator, partial [Chitinophagaceae bacterium]|nr:sigma-54-dependent Fis family transcriptional regulator [Chitinophagaceae bacterium]
TIFLDEIGELPLGTQARLLRVLESGEFIRVGSSKVQKTDVRVIAATNKDLLDLAQAGKFREDLYYRLSTVPIRVPSLRDRKEDIPLLFRKFSSDFSEKYRTQSLQLSPDAQQLLMDYPWPGNVRELKNLAEQISVLSTEREITSDMMRAFMPNGQSRSLALVQPAGIPIPSPSGENKYDNTSEREILYKLFFDLKKDLNEMKQMLYDLTNGGGNFSHTPAADNYSSYPVPETNVPQPYVPQGASSPVVIHTGDNMAQHEEVEDSLYLADMEKEFIVKALKKHKGRRRDAASELGISERTLYRKIKEYDINE